MSNKLQQRRQLLARQNRIVKSFLAVFVGLFVLNILFPPALHKAYQYSPVLVDRNGEWLAGYTNDQGRWRLQTKLDDIDPVFVEHLLTIEDKRFYYHMGVDPIAIVRAVKSWGQSGRIVSGASTLTMQLARQLTPRPRTFGSKIIEAIRAVQIELRLSKREILELYLTHTPYGGNLEGVRAASLSYFDKPPLYLTTAEIALLLALPQAPESRRPDRHANTALSSRNEILQRLYRSDKISQQEWQDEATAILPTSRHQFETIAWLTGRKLLSDLPSTQKRSIGHLRSSLDKDIQKMAETLAKTYTNSLDFNTMVLVVENQTGKVRAHIGSAGRDRPGGWIDMAQTQRSPGSTLKPFIYGFAFDDGLSAPGSWILDAPTRFGGYQPENFNTRYYGAVRVHEALAHSLNVPAVLALDHVGSRRFEAALAASGSKFSGNEHHQTGLALALGGAGMRAEDLASLYRGLANHGMVSPLQWFENKDDNQTKTAPPVRLMLAQSADDITEILKQAPSPDGRVPHWLSQDSPDIAYKTGTSYGFRDAWAAGYTKQWTVIVWAGRPDGAVRMGQTGRLAAAPLLFDVFSNLPQQSLTPDNDDEGQEEGDERVSDINLDTIDFGEIGDHVYRKLDDAPQGLVQFAGTKSDAPIILFPPDGAEISVHEFGEQARGLVLSARNNGDLQTQSSTGPTALKWFVDGREIAQQETSHKTIWYPSARGFYNVLAVSHDGNSTKSTVFVRSIEEVQALRSGL